MNKTAIKNFAIWARNKLIADITYKAGLLGISEKEIKSPLPQSSKDVQFFHIGTKEPYSITGAEIDQRRKLAEVIENKAKNSDYQTAYKAVVEEVAYTWFNRLIAIRFMEVNDYLPSQIRVLSSESANKSEPDLVTNPFDTDFEFTPYEKDRITQLKLDNQLDELFRMLFIKQCNALNAILPELFEKISDYTELLLNVAFTDKDGVVYHLVNDIPDDDFNVLKEGQIEIIGWMYQFYNTELNEIVYDGNMAKSRIPKELLPAATTIYTPDWAIRYMVENSLGRLWLEGHANEELKGQWKYYLDEAEQESDVQKQLDAIREEYKTIKPEDIKVIDPCMGSGHILVYAFDVLMKIYETKGYSQRDAAKSVIEHNIYGLDIDNRAYQLSYFAVMMKARQYNRRILNSETVCHVYPIQESDGISRGQLKYFGAGMDDIERHIAMNQMQYLLDTFSDAKEYGSILTVDNCDWLMLYQFVENMELNGQMMLDAIGLEDTQKQLFRLVEIAAAMAQKYDVVVTNPPYFGSSRFSPKLSAYVNAKYPEVKSDLSMVMYKKAINDFSRQNGFISFITTTSWMFLKSFESLREYTLTHMDFDSLVDFGTELFDGKVGHNPIVAWVNRNHLINKKMVGVRLVDYCYARRNEKENEYFNDRNRYFPSQDTFSKIPGMPVAYWLSGKATENYIHKKLVSSVAETKQGFKTGNNDQFLRLWFEVPFMSSLLTDSDPKTKKWFPCNKGGSYRKWYGNLEYVVNWEKSGYEICNYKDDRGKLLSRPQNLSYNFREGLTWSSISSGPISLRYSNSQMMFESKGSGCFVKDIEDLYPLQGYLNSKVCMLYLGAIAPTLDYSEGSLLKLPYIDFDKKVVEYLVRQCIELARCDWNSFETSWDFTTHPLLTYKILDRPGKVIDAFTNWSKFAESQFEQLKSNEEELNRIFIDIYNLQDEFTPDVQEKDVTIRKADLGRDIRSFISYVVGCVLGRYSLDADGLTYAGGDWDECKYKTYIPDKDNILPITDEEYFEDDIVGVFVGFVKKVYGEDTLEENLNYIANALGNKGNTSREIIRNYFVKDFFKDHCKIYQKRPIYWLFDSGKGDGFKALIYMHRYDENTIGNLRIDYLHRMQRVYDREIARMQETIDNSTNAREVTAAEKRKEKLTKQLKETKDYDEKIAHLALARNAIDLDDGVKVNYEKVQTGADGKMLEVLAKI